jgi:hypothetical protein
VLNEREYFEEKREEHTDELVFAELITRIVESQRANPGGVVKLVDLCAVYEKRLRDFTSSSVNINRTRLKDRILSKLPDIKAYHKGREVVLVFEKDVGQAMITACEYTDGMYLARAAEIVRKEMSQHQTLFTGTFDEVSMTETVPNSLLKLGENAAWVNDRR